MEPNEPKPNAGMSAGKRAKMRRLSEAARSPRRPEPAFLDLVTGKLREEESGRLLASLPPALRSDLTEWRARCAGSVVTGANFPVNKLAGDAARAAARTNRSGSWNADHYRQFPVAGTAVTAMIAETRGGDSCMLTVVSRGPLFRDAQIEFDLGKGLQDRLTLVETGGSCTAQRELSIAWSGLDLTSARFQIIPANQPS